MADLTDDEFRERVSDLLDSELEKGAGARWLLSFAAPDKFLGACVVLAPGFMSAVLISKALGCNPGGQVAGWELGADDYPGIPLGVVLSDDILKRYGLR